eukprot:gene7075-14389_t
MFLRKSQRRSKPVVDALLLSRWSDNLGSNFDINNKICLWQGDITSLKIGAVVNAANTSLLGGGGIDGAIHAAAGAGLYKECMALGGCESGSAKLTKGHGLPAEYILHAVGPMGENPEKLSSCYKTCLNLAKENKIRSLAFCCISTGIYGYPNARAAHVALQTVRQWLEVKENFSSIDLVLFCTFLEKDLDIYKTLLCEYFPLLPPPIPSTSPNQGSPVILPDVAIATATASIENPPLEVEEDVFTPDSISDNVATTTTDNTAIATTTIPTTSIISINPTVEMDVQDTTTNINGNDNTNTNNDNTMNAISNDEQKL